MPLNVCDLQADDRGIPEGLALIGTSKWLRDMQWGRQLSDEEQARIWEVAFSCGRDYFNSLRELGLDCHERPVDRELAKEA
jgi:hypothetical protein